MRRRVIALGAWALAVGGLTVWMSYPSEASDTTGTTPPADPDLDSDTDPWLEELAQIASWHEHADGTARLVLQSVGNSRRAGARLDLRVMAGPLEHRWTASLKPVVAGTDHVVEVDLPPEVLLDPVVTDYVVDLYVRATVDGVTTTAPTAYVAWPNGPAARPVVWTEDQMWQNAPMGIVSATLRAQAPAVTEPAQRVLPPIMSVIRPRRAASPAPGDRGDTGLGELL